LENQGVHEKENLDVHENRLRPVRGQEVGHENLAARRESFAVAWRD
jgi:hypothetical protein